MAEWGASHEDRWAGHWFEAGFHFVAVTADADECWERVSALVPEDENLSVVLVEFSLRELRAAQDVITSLMPVPGVWSRGPNERLNRMTVVVNPGHPSTVARLREVLGTKAGVIDRREDWYLATGTARQRGVL